MAAIWRHSSEPIDPPGSRDEHLAAGDQLAQRRNVDIARRAPEKVLDRNRRQLHGAARAFHIGQGVGGAHGRQTETPRRPEQLVDAPLELQALARDDQPARLDLPGMKLLQHGLELGEEPEDRDVEKTLADVSGLVREQADRFHRIDRVALQAPDQMIRLVAGAGDQHGRAVHPVESAPLLPVRAVGAIKHARPGEEEDLHEPVDQRHRARHHQSALGEEREQHEQGGEHRHRPSDVHQVGDRDESPGVAIEPERPVDRRGRQHHEHGDEGNGIELVPEALQAPAQQKAQEKRQRRCHEVVDDADETARGHLQIPYTTSRF
jgi:hypothetical protein